MTKPKRESSKREPSAASGTSASTRKRGRHDADAVEDSSPAAAPAPMPAHVDAPAEDVAAPSPVAAGTGTGAAAAADAYPGPFGDLHEAPKNRKYTREEHVRSVAHFESLAKLPFAEWKVAKRLFYANITPKRRRQPTSVLDVDETCALYLARLMALPASAFSCLDGAWVTSHMGKDNKVEVLMADIEHQMDSLPGPAKIAATLCIAARNKGITPRGVACANVANGQPLVNLGTDARVYVGGSNRPPNSKTDDCALVLELKKEDRRFKPVGAAGGA